MERKERITLEMSLIDAVVALAEGNPGALTVLKKVLDTDPLEGFFKLLNFDSFGVYGSKIWMLYKDVCGEDLNKVLSLLDDVRLGKISREKLHEMIEQGLRV